MYDIKEVQHGLPVVADAHIGHRSAARALSLWPMWASATTNEEWDHLRTAQARAKPEAPAGGA